MIAECNIALDVPDGMREAALAFPNSRSNDSTVPDSVACELYKHPHGDHVALLLDLGPKDEDGAAWITWRTDGSDITVQHKPYCASKSPSGNDLCWLPAQHRGGCSWERYE